MDPFLVDGSGQMHKAIPAAGRIGWQKKPKKKRQKYFNELLNQVKCRVVKSQQMSCQIICLYVVLSYSQLGKFSCKISETMTNDWGNEWTEKKKCNKNNIFFFVLNGFWFVNFVEQWYLCWFYERIGIGKVSNVSYFLLCVSFKLLRSSIVCAEHKWEDDEKKQQQ